MTKEITKSIVMQEMQDRLALREFDSAKFLFDETVVPVYNIEQHLEEWWVEFKTLPITALGARSFFNIPEDERWTLKRYDVVFMSGVFTIAGVYITRLHTIGAGGSMYLDLTAAQNVSYHEETDVVLTRGDSISMNVDGYTSTGDLRLYIDYRREKIR